MKKVTIKYKDTNKNVVIGYTAMMAPCSPKYTNHVLKKLELKSNIEGECGSIFFFEILISDWVLVPEFSFLNLKQIEIVELAQKLDISVYTTFDEFISLVNEAYYSKIDK
jgi:hypothetical protein